VERQYVGIDLHRRRSVIVRRDDHGVTHSTTRVANGDKEAILAELAAAGPEPEVVVEATNGWYWLVDLLQANGARVHLAHPLGNNWGNRRVKNDERDATDLVDLLRLGRLAEAYIAPPESVSCVSSSAIATSSSASPPRPKHRSPRCWRKRG